MADGTDAGSSPTVTMAVSLSRAAGSDVGQDRQEIDAAEARRAGQHPGAGAAHDVGDLDGAIARVHGDGDGADTDAGEVEDRIGRHVGQPQRHAIARSDAQVREALGRAPCALGEFEEEIVRSP